MVWKQRPGPWSFDRGTRTEQNKTKSKSRVVSPLPLSLSVGVSPPLFRTAVGKSLPFNEPVRKPALHQLFCFCSCLLLFLCHCYAIAIASWLCHTHTHTHSLAQHSHTHGSTQRHTCGSVSVFSLRRLHTDVVKIIEATGNFKF